MATAPVVQQQDEQDETGVSFEFRLLTEADKPLVAFNDGDLSYTVILIGDISEPVLHATAQFRSMTVLSEDEYQCKAAGMKDFVSKPFTIERLENVIHKWTDVRDLRLM